MRLWSEVMVASESDEFVDSVSYSLQDEGAVVVCVTMVDDAIQVLEAGFRPEVLVVDGAMRSGPELVARARQAPECKLIPVVVAAPVRDAGEPAPVTGFTRGP